MPKCESWLADLIKQAGGHITFERFMEFALHHPQHGYYAAKVRSVGPAGDFSTSATLCPAFGEALARWSLARARETFADESFALIELGAGDGQLAEHFISTWQRLDAPDVPYFAVESSPPLAKALSVQAAKPQLQVIATPAEALSRCQGRAIIFSNELVDAFPARQLCWDGEDWREVGLCLEHGQLIEGLLPFSDAVDADAPTRTRPGQRIFIHPAYHHWLREQFADWRAGRLLTIDYGARYPSTDCRAYRGQTRLEGGAIYELAGQQDITCDVNFTDLQRWGEQIGWTSIHFAPQSEFFEQWLPGLAQRRETDEALAYLANPLGAGGAFLTLEQRAG